MRVDRFGADPADLRITTPLDGVTLIYHRLSGATHVVAPPAPEVLAALEEGPADPSAVLERLERSYGIGGDVDAVAAIIARLHELEAAGLVFRVAGA